MLGLFLLVLTNIVIALSGLLLFIKESRQDNLSVLFLILDEHDNYIEDLSRYIISKVKQEAIRNRLVIAYDISGPDTIGIISMLARDLSFEACMIHDLQEISLLSNYLDLRKQVDRKEKKRLIKRFFREQKIEYQYGLP